MNNESKFKIEYKNSQPGIINLLLDKNIDIKIKDKFVIECASPSSYLGAIEFLIEKVLILI